ncbi:MAG: metal-sulfur cluster assembly factor [Bacteroidetes bacterium]|nr:metal-sulfur cluster assembly factor [Bacteroidota bacterium]
MNILTNNEKFCNQSLKQLRNVIDPEIGLNIVDLGLLYELNLEEGKIVCRMTLTSQFCPMGEVILDGVHEALQNTFEGYQVEIELTFEPPWNEERISEHGRHFLRQ